MLSILAALPLLLQGGPPPGYNWTLNPANGHYYTLTATMQWPDAAAEAARLGPGTSLVTIRNLDEQHWLWLTIAGQNQAWTGYNDIGHEGTWTWWNGEVTPYWAANGYFGRNGEPGYWLPNQPDNAGGNENYCHLSGAERWNDAGSGLERNPAILEWIPTSLTASTHQISSAAGGTVTFTIDFPQSDAGTKYKLLGSTTGLGPTTIGGIQVPLSDGNWLWDAMLDFPEPNVFNGANGRLDPDGDAAAALTLPPGLAGSLVGSTLYFAVVLYNPATYTGIKSSSAVPLTMVL